MEKLMRPLWSLALVCLVAATGVRQADVRDARGELHTSSVVRVAPPATRTLATRPVQHALTGRVSGPALKLPPIALAASFSLRYPPSRAYAQVSFSDDRVFVFPALTCFARGPPIA